MKTIFTLLALLISASNALAENAIGSQVVCREATISTYRVDTGDPLTMACGKAQEEINRFLLGKRFKDVSAPSMSSSSGTSSEGYNTPYSYSENKAYCQICITTVSETDEENKKSAELWCRGSWYEVARGSDESARSLSCNKAQERLNSVLASTEYSSASAAGSTTTTWKTRYERGASCQSCSLLLR
jgi:hypothetical protein